MKGKNAILFIIIYFQNNILFKKRFSKSSTLTTIINNLANKFNTEEQYNDVNNFMISIF